jgi:hypothetical protein
MAVVHMVRDPVIHMIREHLVCLDWEGILPIASRSAAPLKRFSLCYDPDKIHDVKSIDWIGLGWICDEDSDLKSGLFENYVDDMLAIDSTHFIENIINPYKTNSILLACSESGRPWALRGFAYHRKPFCTVSFEDDAGVIEFKLRL